MTTFCIAFYQSNLSRVGTDLTYSGDAQHLVLTEHIAVLRGVVAWISGPVSFAGPRGSIPAGGSPEAKFIVPD
jgi:hypothetical protein